MIPRRRIVAFRGPLAVLACGHTSTLGALDARRPVACLACRVPEQRPGDWLADFVSPAGGAMGSERWEPSARLEDSRRHGDDP